jgi:predicted nucleic acid-binding protein
MVLVDTSVWVAHFRHANHTLTALLNADQVVCHPFIVAEIACGTPPHRARTLAGLG